MYNKFTFLLFLSVSCISLCSACEGECIVGITKAFTGNYSEPVYNVVRQLAEEVSSKLLPPSSRPADPITLMQPIFSAYSKASYDSMENAIFPSYFHGKCQRFSKDGQDPPGCPDPDCPVVCGTPGSLVHFYPTLRYIAFNDTRGVLENVTKPGSPPYQQIEELIKNAQSHNRRETRSKKAMYRTASNDTDYMATSSSVDASYLHSRMEILHPDSKAKRRHRAHRLSARSLPTNDLSDILSQVGVLLERYCGGPATENTNALPQCSWETSMKAYILSFP